ncbi:MAG: Bax inhibitor-1/YccA family protein [Candidatus Peribacteraceae bacterium]|nr:Bax inhibitor-1/YccA family protein [Candidatus Peribacteraceae bacterium]
MQNFSTISGSQPLSLSKSTESQVYGLFAVAMALTVGGVAIGMQYSDILLSTGIYILLIIGQLGLIFTSRLWVEKSPLNFLLFGLFPIFSGLSITPLIISVLTGYANGSTILLNALSATAFMAGASAVFAKTTSWNLGVMGKALFFAIIGLIVMGLLQMFVPALRTTQMELMISGAGIIIFAGFTAYDVQRISGLASKGYNPIMLALSLYLDIFNLFIYILRFMLVLSGDRR